MHCSISCHRPSPFDEDWETTMGKSGRSGTTERGDCRLSAPQLAKPAWTGNIPAKLPHRKTVSEPLPSRSLQCASKPRGGGGKRYASSPPELLRARHAAVPAGLASRRPQLGDRRRRAELGPIDEKRLEGTPEEAAAAWRRSWRRRLLQRRRQSPRKQRWGRRRWGFSAWETTTISGSN